LKCAHIFLYCQSVSCLPHFNDLRNIFAKNDQKVYKNWAPNPKGALPTTLVNISSEVKKVADNHVAVFPVSLPEYFIKGSTNEGDIVLDPFMGTGTTAIAALNLKRNYLGFELQQSYIDLAKKRIEDVCINTI